MGDHSKVSKTSAVLAFVRSHKKTVLAVASALVAVLAVLRPDVPGAQVLGVLSALLGA